MNAPESPNSGVENVTPMMQSEMQNAEKLINRERALTPKMVSSLLNVNVLLQSERIHSTESVEDSHTMLYSFLMVFCAIGVALGVGTAFLYIHEIGPFYSSADAMDRF